MQATVGYISIFLFATLYHLRTGRKYHRLQALILLNLENFVSYSHSSHQAAQCSFSSHRLFLIRRWAVINSAFALRLGNRWTDVEIITSDYFYSHSTVAGGLPVISYTTRLT